MNDDQAGAWIDTGEEAMSQAVALFRGGWGQSPQAHLKDDRDPVSEVDLRIESTVRRFLESVTGPGTFLGEETGGGIPQRGPCWILDPIDGTVNFLNASPLCGISLALVVDGDLTWGAVEFPVLGESYRGGRDIPAQLNRSLIKPQEPPALSDCVVSTGDFAVGPGSPDKNRVRTALVTALADRAYRVRMIGSAAIDLTWLASGRHGASVILSNKPWDMAAGVAIARASGVTVLGRHGQLWQFDSTAVMASASRGILEELERLVQISENPGRDGRTES